MIANDPVQTGTARALILSITAAPNAYSEGVSDYPMGSR